MRTNEWWRDQASQIYQTMLQKVILALALGVASAQQVF
jgi:hypothetical protein